MGKVTFLNMSKRGAAMLNILSNVSQTDDQGKNVSGPYVHVKRTMFISLDCFIF